MAETTIFKKEISYLALKSLFLFNLNVSISDIWESRRWGHTGEDLAEKKLEGNSCPCGELFYFVFNLKLTPKLYFHETVFKFVT